MRPKLAAVPVITAVTVCCAPAAGAITGDEMCNAMHWPMPLPPTVGWFLMHLTNDTILSCIDNVTATAPDGHDAMNDPALDAYKWRITSMNPAAGTLIPRNQQITLTVVHDDNAPS